MSEDNGETSVLYRKYRPRSLKELIGQPEASKAIQAMLDSNRIPNTLLLSGPSGVGKTTIARILRKKLGCSNHDFTEVNCASVESPIETVRSIEQRIGMAPMGGDCRIWLLDEVQSLSRAGFAQQALLKILEDTPSHVYFFLCTTDVSKIIKTVQTRCTNIKFRILTAVEVKQVINSVVVRENIKLSESVLDKIVEVADGSPRQALTTLQKVISLPTEQEQLDVITKGDLNKQAFDLVKALLWEKNTWKDIATIIEQLGPDQDWEGIRRLMLKCTSNEVLKANRNSKWACHILVCCRDHWYDCGRAGLVQACYEVMEDRRK